MNEECNGCILKHKYCCINKYRSSYNGECPCSICLMKPVCGEPDIYYCSIRMTYIFYNDPNIAYRKALANDTM